MPKLLKKDSGGGAAPGGPGGGSPTNGITVGPLPPGIRNVVAGFEPGPNGSSLIQLEVTPDTQGASGSQIVQGTDIVLVLDASFSMYASAYRNLKVFDMVDQIVRFLNPFDEDGIDLYLHSLRDTPFKHFGAISSPGEAQTHLTDFVEIGTARKLMGTRTVCAPVIRDIVQRLKVEKRSENVLIAVLTDGEFDDEAEVEKCIVEFGKKYNTKEEPYGFKLHFTGFGNLQFKFLKRLDDEMEQRYPGFIDCVDFDTSADIEKAVASMVKEFQSTVICAGQNGTVSVQSDSPIIRVGDAKTNRYEDGDFYSGFEVVPAVVNIGFEARGRPSQATVNLCFENVNGSLCEYAIPLRL